MPSDSAQRCIYCNDYVSTRSGAGNMRQVTGWEELRRGGGANKIVRRTPTGLWAHRACLQYQGRGRDKTLF